MDRQIKSQWDFGELFPAEPTRKVLSVSELTAQIRRLLEKQVGAIWVTGEVTNLRAQSSGHIYFTLKDAGAQLNCVLFRGEPVSNRSALRDGQQILLQGDVTVYEARGQYQLIVHAVELQGVGALQIAFEKLKQKLAAEGLFALERKRPLPKYPQRIGLVTSSTGAAIHDVMHVVQRRNPSLEIILAPCRVQGEGAAAEIADAIRLLNEFNLQSSTFNLQLILVARGGGSLEDLWAFNEEVVARAIFEFLNRLCRSCRRWGMKLISASAILWRTCAPPRRAPRRRSSPKTCLPAATSWRMPRRCCGGGFGNGWGI
jgi:exodeoxyribonuclease VII large subunit